MVALTLWLIGALAAAPAGARPVAVQVDCGLGECPSVADLQRRLVAVLGYDPIEAGASRRVAVRFAAAGAGVATELRLHDDAGPAGARRFETAVADWDAVLSATVMNLALIVEPGRLDLLMPPAAPPPEPLPPGPAPDPPAAEPLPAEAPPEPEPPPEPPPRPTPHPALEIEATLGAGATWGLTPGPAAHLHLGAGLWRGVLGGALAVRYTPTSAVDFASGAVLADLVAADAAGCLRRGPYAGCVTALAGLQTATSSGLPEARTVRVPVLAVGARGAALWPVWTGLRLGLSLDVRAPLSRTRLRIGGRLAWETAPVAVDGLGALSWIF